MTTIPLLNIPVSLISSIHLLAFPLSCLVSCVWMCCKCIRNKPEKSLIFFLVFILHKNTNLHCTSHTLSQNQHLFPLSPFCRSVAATIVLLSHFFHVFLCHPSLLLSLIPFLISGFNVVYFHPSTANIHGGLQCWNKDGSLLEKYLDQIFIYCWIAEQQVLHVCVQ